LSPTSAPFFSRRKPRGDLEVSPILRTNTWCKHQRFNLPCSSAPLQSMTTAASLVHPKASRDTFHEVPCLSTESVGRVVITSVCLTDARRSQGFSPSQRIVPRQTLQLCFTLHPSLGFQPSELFPPDQPHEPRRLRLLSCGFDSLGYDGLPQSTAWDVVHFRAFFRSDSRHRGAWC